MYRTATGTLTDCRPGYGRGSLVSIRDSSVDMSGGNDCKDAGFDAGRLVDDCRSANAERVGERYASAARKLLVNAQEPSAIEPMVRVHIVRSKLGQSR